MKTKIAHIPFLVAIILASCVSSTTKELTSTEKAKISKDLIEISNDWVESMKNHDLDKFGEILSDQITYYVDAGEFWDKDRLLEDCESAPVFDSTLVYDMQIDVYNSEFAMIMGKALFIYQDDDGEAVEDRSLWSNLYKKENEQWKCVFGMGCEIGE